MKEYRKKRAEAKKNGTYDYNKIDYVATFYLILDLAAYFHGIFRRPVLYLYARKILEERRKNKEHRDPNDKDV